MKKPNRIQTARGHLPTNEPPGKGFTLVELMVVIAIIAALSVIGVSVFQKTRTKALRTVSASNLRTLYMASTQYSSDNNMDLPNAFIQPNSDLGRTQGSWRLQLVEGGYLGSPDNGKGAFPVNYKVLGSPIQWREAADITVNRNPPVYPTYGMNIVKTMITGDMTRAIKVLHLVDPSRRLFISEGHLAGGSSYFAVGVSPYGAIPNRTDGIITFIYADGHLGQMTTEEFPKTVGNPGSKSWHFWDGVE